MSLDRIYVYDFISLEGQPIWPTMRIKPIQRAGVDGTAFLLIGKAGQEFTLVSGVDVADMNAGYSLLYEYQQLIGASPVTLMKGGVEHSDVNRYVEVLNVQEERLFAIENSTGGLVANSRAYLQARWTLMGLEMIPAA